MTSVIPLEFPCNGVCVGVCKPISLFHYIHCCIFHICSTCVTGWCPLFTGGYFVIIIMQYVCVHIKYIMLVPQVHVSTTH